MCMECLLIFPRCRVSATYPKLLVVPGSVSDEELLQVAKFRMLGRLPVVVWRSEFTWGGHSATLI